MGIGILRGALVVVALTLASFAGIASAGSTTVATARCKTVITGTHWSITGAGSGNRYVLGTEGMSCAAAKPWALRLMALKAGQAMKGPRGFNCHSFATPSGGDKLDYAGVCLRPPGVPFFEWGPKP